MRSLLALSVAALSTACSGALAQGDGRAFGDDLGRFHVAATLEASTCGPNAIDAPARWEFDVFLSHLASHLYWNTGADAVEGDLAEDGKRFTMTSETVVNTSSQAGGDATCTIVRSDRSAGELDDATRARQFDGTLDYRFTPQGKSDCADLLLSGTFATLPCSMKYRMKASWVSAR
jgi:hypothetical protein